MKTINNFPPYGRSIIFVKKKKEKKIKLGGKKKFKILLPATKISCLVLHRQLSFGKMSFATVRFRVRNEIMRFVRHKALRLERKALQISKKSNFIGKSRTRSYMSLRKIKKGACFIELHNK